MRGYVRWDSLADQRLRDLLVCQVTYAEIAKVLGRRIPGIVSRARKLGLRSSVPHQNQYRP
jgi:hypothetical protein